jgi:ArsR family transcriptional regulator
VKRLTTTDPAITSMAEILKLLSDKTRLTIVALLKEREMCVCDLVDILETTQPNISQHLKKLKSGGIVNETRRSQWVYYSLNLQDKPYLNDVIKHLPSMKETIDAHQPNSCC